MLQGSINQSVVTGHVPQNQSILTGQQMMNSSVVTGQGSISLPAKDGYVTLNSMQPAQNIKNPEEFQKQLNQEGFEVK